MSDNKVFVIRDGKALLTGIQAGVNYGEKVQVVAGLETGDQVVVSGQINLVDSTAVRILE